MGFLRGVIVGGLLGTVGAILNAPMKGREFRQSATTYVKTIQQDAKTVGTNVNRFKESVTYLKESGLPVVNDVVEEVKETLRHFQEETSPHFKRLEDRIAQLNQHATTIQRALRHDEDETEHEHK